MIKEKNYRVIKISINKKRYPEICEHFEKAAHVANDVYNTALFVLRNNYSAHIKELKGEPLSENELMIQERLFSIKQMVNKNRELPLIIDYQKIYHYFKNYENFHKECYRKIHTTVISSAYIQACQDFKGYFNAQKAFNKNKSNFSGRPKKPSYKEKGQMSNFSLSGKTSLLIKEENDKYYLQIPCIKKFISIPRYCAEAGELKCANVSPSYDGFNISLIYDEDYEKYKKVVPIYYAGIDIGVNNLITLVSNCEKKECVIFSGKIIKSINQWYNKQSSFLKSLLMKQEKSSKVKSFKTTALTQKRNNQIDDHVQKLCKKVIDYCLDNNIGTIVIGENKGWKKEANIGKVNNQNFIQLPMDKIKRNLEFRAKRHDITVIFREEAYTSKADYLAKDTIPDIKDEKEHSFSGKRIKRGLYRSSTGNIINADCNGAANILRKQFPEIDISLECFYNIKKISYFE